MTFQPHDAFRASSAQRLFSVRQAFPANKPAVEDLRVKQFGTSPALSAFILFAAACATQLRLRIC